MKLPPADNQPSLAQRLEIRESGSVSALCQSKVGSWSCEHEVARQTMVSPGSHCI